MFQYVAGTVCAMRQVSEHEFVGAAGAAGFPAAEVRALLAQAEAKNLVMVRDATIFVI
jgi:hypothetical protein